MEGSRPGANWPLLVAGPGPFVCFLMEGIQMTVGPAQASHRRAGTVERETAG